MDTATYNRMVLERIQTDSPEIFGNLTPENARFIVPEFIKSAKESIVIFSGSMPPWFYMEEDATAGKPILDVIREAANNLHELFADNAAGAIRILTANGKFDPTLDEFEEAVAQQNNGVRVVRIVQAAYAGNASELQHFIVIDHKRYRLETPHIVCRNEKLKVVMAEVCCNGPAKARRLESMFNAIWTRLTAKRSA